MMRRLTGLIILALGAGIRRGMLREALGDSAWSCLLTLTSRHIEVECPRAHVGANGQSSPANTERTLASTHCFSVSVMMPASRRQLALKDMNEADGASLIGKISSRFTGDFIVLTPKSPFLPQDRHGAG